MYVSTDNGATYITAAGSYSWGWQQMSNSGGVTNTNSNSATEILVGNSVSYGDLFGPPSSSLNGVMYMASPLDNTQGTQFWGSLSSNNSATYNNNTYVGGGYRKNAEANNAIKFMDNVGQTITSGTIQIFGVQK